MTAADLTAAVIGAAREALAERALDPAAVPVAAVVARPRDPVNGDYVSTVALQVARRTGEPARALAAAIASRLEAMPAIAAATVAGAGFVNVRLAPAAVGALAGTVVQAGRGYGRSPGQAPAAGAQPAGGEAGALRYARLRARPGTPVTADLDELTRESPANPYHRVRYAHASLAGLLRHAADLGISRGDGYDPQLLGTGPARGLLTALGEFPQVAAGTPDLLARYLEELVDQYDRFESRHRILPPGDEPATGQTRAWLWLADALRIVLANGLDLLGVEAPERL